jgi:hypothetical protein
MGKVHKPMGQLINGKIKRIISFNKNNITKDYTFVCNGFRLPLPPLPILLH